MAAAKEPCARCGAELARSARFCKACGAVAAAYDRERRERHRVRLRLGNRAVAAIALSFTCVLGAVVVYAAASVELEPALALGIVFHASLVAVAVVSALVAGGGALRASWAGGTGLRGLALGLGTGIAALIVNWAYVEVLSRLVGAEGAVEPRTERLPVLLLTMALLPALAEEWLCRGVLWEVAGRAVPLAGTIAVTAVLFGLLHGFQGWLLVPHRVATGVLIGILRWRTGSLIPCVVAHFTNNALAIAFS